ncbi:MAG TPA: cohesin domain-containing protein [Candidatus Acidoferrales bacterium]|jgi:general secretion pathway protein D|nr:cohesin domain-containing protein [Candidatus Acidoferrales bacterium]
MNLRNLCALVLVLAAVFLTGCPKASQDNNAGTKAEALHDYDTALDYYNKALQTSPTNTEYRLKAERARFEAAQWHVDQGRRIRDQGSLELALAEFRKAMMIDPSSAVAQQEVKATMDLMNAKQGNQGNTQNGTPSGAASDEPQLMTGPPQVQPLSRAPINMKATNDSKAVFEAIGKLAGLTVIFDPDFTSRRISVELTNVTLEQALNITSLESKAFWRPVTSNIIFVVPDQPQKRKDYEEQIVKTFYLHNTVLPQELTEIVTSIRQLLDLRRVQQINAQNAIVIRDTPDRVLLAGKIIDDIDKAKPEVVIQVAVMEARRDRMRNVGITPPSSVSTAFVNPVTSTTSSTTNSSTTTTTNGTATFSQLLAAPFANILPQGYSITLPSATANFLMTDTSTQILDDPEIRVVDGQTAKLRIGDRIPVATGSFQAGIGVGATTGAVNPLVNTQFQYLDVGVNVDVTPRIHPDHEISMKVNVVVSSQTNTVNIGGINQPVISQRSIEHDIRLKDGEVNVLGGLIEQTDSDQITGLPGLAKVPGFRYLFGNSTIDHEKDEILIVLIPHIVRMPTFSAENLRSIASGTDTNAEVRLADAVLLPDNLKPQAGPASLPAPAAASVPAPATTAAPANTSMSQNASLQFEPGTAALKVGETSTIGVSVQNVQDLYSIPMLVQFNPAVISIEDVRQGGFLSGGTQEVAIVERVDKERGQAIISATRMPNTPGVSGSGTLVGIVVKALAPGNSQLSIVQVNAKDSQQRPIQVVTGEATIRVQ